MTLSVFKSYGVSFVRILEKINRVIRAPHYTAFLGWVVAILLVSNHFAFVFADEDRQRHSSSGSGAVRSSQQPSSSSSSSSQQQARPLHYSHSLPDHRHSPYHVNATQRPMAGQDVPALSRTMSEGHKSRGRSSEESWGQGGYVSTHGSRAHHNSAVHNGARAADNSRHEGEYTFSFYTYISIYSRFLIHVRYSKILIPAWMFLNCREHTVAPCKIPCTWFSLR